MVETGVAPDKQLEALHPQLVPITSLRINPAALQAQKEDILLLEQFVQDVLERDVDWGQVPGIPQPFLWEPGADKVAGAYHTYTRPVLLKEEVDPVKQLITYIVQAEVIKYSGQVVATGIGIASTTEGKWGSRWVSDPKEVGYDPAKLRKKTDRETGEVKYRIPNPDWGDLVHTLLQLAYKRAKVDAVQGLPGVSSSLRRLFTGKRRAEPKDEFPYFWREMKALGLSHEEVHRLLQVKSLYDWLETHSLKEARDLILTKINVAPASSPTPAPLPEEKAATPPTASGAAQVQATDVQTPNDLFRLCNRFWKLQPAAVAKELGYKTQQDIKETPWDCFEKIRAART